MSHGRRLARGRRFRTSQTWAAVLTHEPMQSSFRAMSLVFALAGSLVFCVGCSQGEGGRCEIDSDCASGLICSVTGSPHNGVCRPISSPGGGGGTVPAVVADAGDDSSAMEADAGDDGPAVEADAAASVDAGVAADGAVGVDTLPDAQAATDLSATD